MLHKNYVNTASIEMYVLHQLNIPLLIWIFSNTHMTNQVFTTAAITLLFIKSSSKYDLILEEQLNCYIECFEKKLILHIW